MKNIWRKITYWAWRVNRLRCLIKHDFKNEYTRYTDVSVSGRNDCQRCYESEYFWRKVKS